MISHCVSGTSRTSGSDRRDGIGWCWFAWTKGKSSAHREDCSFSVFVGFSPDVLIYSVFSNIYKCFITNPFLFRGTEACLDLLDLQDHQGSAFLVQRWSAPFQTKACTWKPLTSCWKTSRKTRSLFSLQGTVGRTGQPGPPGVPGEGIQGQKVLLSAEDSERLDESSL